MGLPASLIRRHNAAAGLEIIGVSLPAANPPTITKCPQCNQDTLYLFDDPVIEGFWLHCASCQITGDILTFAAELWKSTLYTAIEPFIDAGLILRADSSAALGNCIRAVQKRKAAEDLWREAKQQLWNHHDEIIADKLRILGASAQLTECADLIGVAHFDQIEHFCREAGKRPPRPVRGKAPMLVLPYYDLPGRNSGILCVQYTETERAKKSFICLNPHAHRRPDAGYWGINTITIKTWAAIKNAYFVLDDPLLAVALQIGQLRYGQPFLPVTGAYAGAEAASTGITLPAACAAQKFISGCALTPELVSLAANSHGYVCARAENARKKAATPTRTLRYLAENRRIAATWSDAILAVAKQSSEITILNFCSKLVIEPEKLQKTLQKHEAHVSAVLRDKILTTVKIPLAGPATTRQRWKVIARNGGWYTTVGKEIVNAQIKITRIVQTAEHKKYYEGLIEIDGAQIEFFEADSRITRLGLLAYSAELCAQRGLVLIFNRNWNNRALDVALRLHKPTVDYVSDAIGWDDSTSEFKFQSYSIQSDGNLRFQATTPLHKKKLLFPPPSDGLPIDLNQLLGAEHEKTLTWNLFAFFMATLLAPAGGKEYRTLVVPPNIFLATQRIAAALHCHKKEVLANSRKGAGQTITAAAKKSDWPTLIFSGINDLLLAPSIPRYTHQPFWYRGNALTAAAATSYGSYGIDTATIGNYHSDHHAALAALVPRYLQHLLRHRACLGAGDWFDNILRDLHAWLFKTYGATFNIEYAKNQRLVPQKTHEYLIRCVRGLAETGVLDILPRPRRKDQPNNYMLLTNKNLWINQKAIDRFFQHKAGLTWNWLEITTALSKQGVFMGEEILHNNLPGFLISADWYLNFQDQIYSTQGTG